jgi:two-component system phosphate regulon sensor histidine kinase PhoR
VGGTGLGLAIVKHILEAHQTTPNVESMPGEGTTISFTLKI